MSKNLISNPGAENGNIGGWVVSGTVSWKVLLTGTNAGGIKVYSRSGLYLFLGSSSGTAIMTQTLALEVGNQYTVSLWTYCNCDVSSNTMQISIGSNSNYLVPSAKLGPPYTQYTTTFIADSPSETFNIISTQGYCYVLLDDISVILSQPTTMPTTFSTVSPTAFPSIIITAGPTQTPSSMPSSPTFAPSVHPTIPPSVIQTHSPTSSPTFFPTACPTFAPTKIPSVSPSLAPSLSPSTSPTRDIFNIEINQGGYYYGSILSENFIISLDNGVRLTISGGGGTDRYTFSPNFNTIVTITDFDKDNEQIDLRAFENINSYNDLIVKQGSIIIHLDNNQVITLLNLVPSDINSDNFIFSSATQTGKKGDNNFLSYTLGGSIGGLSIISAGLMWFSKRICFSAFDAWGNQKADIIEGFNLKNTILYPCQFYKDSYLDAKIAGFKRMNDFRSINNHLSKASVVPGTLDDLEALPNEANEMDSRVKNSGSFIPMDVSVRTKYVKAGILSIDAMIDPQHVERQNEEFARFGRHLTYAYQDIAKLVSEQFSSSQSLLKYDVMPAEGESPIPETNFISTDLSVSFPRIQNALELYPLVKYISTNIVYPLVENYLPESLQNITLPEISNTMLVTVHMSIGHLYAWQQLQGNVPFYIVESVAKSGSFAAKLGVTKFINDYKDALEHNEQTITTSEAIKHCVSTILTYTVPDLLICTAAKTAMPSYECGDLNLGAKLSFAGSECHWSYKASQEPIEPTTADVVVPYIADIAAGVAAYVNGYGLMGVLSSIVAADWMSKAVMDAVPNEIKVYADLALDSAVEFVTAKVLGSYSSFFENT